MNEKYNIICFSNQLWDFPNWTNKKHVMTRLAKAGHSVLFVDPPINTGFVFVRQIARKLWGLMRLITQKKRDASGALVYTPLNMIPFGSITSRLHALRIKSLVSRFFAKDRKTILWIYHVEMPGLENYLEGLKYDLLIYDCVDDYPSFPRYDTSTKKQWLEKQEELLAQKADIVFATTPGLVEKLKSYNSNVFFTPNAGDYEKFKDAQSSKDQMPEDLKEIPRPRIGYVGALDPYKFDYSLMKEVIKAYPKYSFVLIGQLALQDKNLGENPFADLDNVYLLGPRSYETIEKYYSGFDTYLIPYVLDDYTVKGCFPVKFHDALAAGLPVVVTDLPAYTPFKEACYVSKTSEEFIENVKKSLEEDNQERVKQRQLVAKENSWEGKIEKMLGYIRESI